MVRADYVIWLYRAVRVLDTPLTLDLERGIIDEVERFGDIQRIVNPRTRVIIGRRVLLSRSFSFP